MNLTNNPIVSQMPYNLTEGAAPVLALRTCRTWMFSHYQRGVCLDLLWRLRDVAL